MIEERNIYALLEAVLFAQGQPVKLEFLSGLAGSSLPETEIALLQLQKRYESEDHGIRLMQSGESWVLVTKPVYAAVIAQALELSRQVPLSRSAMEVLAIIAYKQPISRGYVDNIRGVDSAHPVHTLLEKGLIEEAGRLDVPGRPILYQTTELFLRSFQLRSLDDLPELPSEYEQLAYPEETGEEQDLLS